MKFAQFCQSVWNWVVEKFNAIRSFVGGAFSNLWVRLKDFAVFNKIGSIFTVVKDKLAVWFAPILQKLSDLGILGIITKWAGPVLSVVSLIPLIKTVIDMIKNKKKTQPTTITEAANFGSDEVKKAIGKRFAKTAFENREDFTNSKKQLRKLHVDDVKAAKDSFKNTSVSEKFEKIFSDIEQVDGNLIKAAASSEFGRFLMAEYNMSAREAAKHVLYKRYKDVQKEKKLKRIDAALGLTSSTVEVDDEKKEETKAEKKKAKKSKKDSSKKAENKSKSKKDKTVIDEMSDDDLVFYDALNQADTPVLEKFDKVFDEYDVGYVLRKMQNGESLNPVEDKIMKFVMMSYTVFIEHVKDNARKLGYV